MRTKWRGSLCKAPQCAATIRQLVGQESGRVAGARANLPRVCGPCVLCPCRRASRCPPAHLAPAPCSIRWRSRSRSRSRRRRRAGVPRCPAAPRAARPCHPLLALSCPAPCGLGLVRTCTPRWWAGGRRVAYALHMQYMCCATPPAIGVCTAHMLHMQCMCVCGVQGGTRPVKGISDLPMMSPYAGTMIWTYVCV